MRTIGIRSTFAYDLLWSYAGGYNEFEVAIACTSKEIGRSLKAKIERALDEAQDFDLVPDIRLELTVDESLCLGVASMNCATNDLPAAQRHQLEAWNEEWTKSRFAAVLDEDPLAKTMISDMRFEEVFA